MGPAKTLPRKLIAVIIVGALIVIAALLIGLKPWDTSKKSPAPAAATQWTTYKATKYGFEFDYPATWGDPTITARGSDVSLTFPNKKTSQAQSAVLFYMAPESKGLNKVYVDNLIKTAKSDAAAYDTSSYTHVVYVSNEKVNGLTMYQEVSLPKINISVVTVTYQVTNAQNCPQNQLSSQAGCITKSDYETISRVAKSIKQL